jgi:hypothetical protein
MGTPLLGWTKYVDFSYKTNVERDTNFSGWTKYLDLMQQPAVRTG